MGGGDDEADSGCNSTLEPGINQMYPKALLGMGMEALKAIEVSSWCLQRSVLVSNFRAYCARENLY
ncbi:hypothetical protein P3T76_012226 [Phytophthora citrophthora]|uniref:Uncharacterized protein n=1 Tax=Phytophthora citrophthora TaxID=4793 RepID=A0AAD9G5M5_9STRA|nr:hypothetical protein P3T76_012226 [Phytophthora citrophthora]